ncbi:MAG: B12-binding domain-containing radical SAM protein [Desulfobacteraceae bacterium]|nr:B12-binding domain-containing radical SAM protein [Desulfobacteraceae bacterium]
MPDILLIQPPLQDFYLTAKRTVPYGLASIAAVLRSQGFSVGLLDALATDKSRPLDWPGQMAHLKPFYGRQDLSPFNLFHRFRHFGYSMEHLVLQARRSNAFLIGLSVLFSAYSGVALALAQAIKKALPRCVIVMGGHHPTALPQEVMRCSAVDYVLRGDGEIGMPLLAKALRQAKRPWPIPGLVSRNRHGELSVSPPAVVEDLAQLPVPAFDLMDQRHYNRSRRLSITLCATRGCPMRCSYCAVNKNSYHGFRRRSIDSVMAEIKTAAAGVKPGFIDFEDEHLSSDPAWFKNLLKAIGKLWPDDPPELRAMNGLYAPSLDQDSIRLMRKAGFKTVNLALITTDSEQLRRFKRPDIRRDLDRVLTLAEKFGLTSVVYLIVAGPEQDPYGSVEDLLYLAQRRALAGISVFYPAPASPDYHWCRDQGLLPDGFGLLRATALPLDHVTSRTQAVTLLRLGRILNFMKNLLDQGQNLPAPEPLNVNDEALHGADRVRLGKHLLAAFLYHKRIYGADGAGNVYEHQCDNDLIRRFISRLQEVNLSGVIRARSDGANL